MLAKLFAPHFADGAAIVNIASTRAFASQSDTESYSAAKGGVIALTHALAISLAGKVRVNAISPGWINNHPEEKFSAADHRQQPVGRIGKPQDIARAARFLCSADAGFITGQNLMIDGGMSKLMVYHGDGGWSFAGA
jgi:NAD(P)-dependent dehydrogenase (short-subunit alcohol dehydrogenase family)